MKKTIAIVGGGASALMLACELNSKKYNISLFEKNAALGRKFLVAGDGGLNLTHSENEKAFNLNYTPHQFLLPALTHFSNKDLVVSMNRLGIETFVGTSGRVFPKKGIKPIMVLEKFIETIRNKNIRVYFKHEWKGFSENNELLFETPLGIKKQIFDSVIFCLGGASWPVTGSKGDWVHFFTEKSIQVNSFKASNCSFKINWPNEIIKQIVGKPLKNCAITCANKTHLGEVVLTNFGIEGSGIYPLSPLIRGEIEKYGSSKITIDFKPQLSFNEVLKRISCPATKNSYTENIAKQLNLTKTHLALLKANSNKHDFLDPVKLTAHLKKMELVISELGPVNKAISTVGGIDLNEISEKFELKKLKNNFVIGEMLDYDAPTGGYLLQSCFSMGKFLADYLNTL